MAAFITIVIMVGLVWFWVDSLRAREQILRYCTKVCEEMNVQLLDQTVSLSRLGLARDQQGRIHLYRCYAFEFSADGSDRRVGSAILLGSHVELVRMEHPDGTMIVEPGDYGVQRLQ